MKKYVQGEFITAFQYGVDSPPFWFYHTCISDEETTYIEKTMEPIIFGNFLVLEKDGSVTQYEEKEFLKKFLVVYIKRIKLL